MALTFDQDQNNTIAAIATGMSESGIGIIRISGPDAEQVIDRVYRTGRGSHKKEWDPNTIHYGYIVDPETENRIDEVLVSWMKAPHSYTTEDTAEINTHGGIYVMKKVLSAVLQAGARLAEPGEFTKRAFLGGRIDLSEAEAVMDLIQSRNEFSRRTSLAQLKGSVSGSIREMRSEILYEIAHIESALDDPENYSLEGYPEHLREVCSSLTCQLEKMIDRSQNGSLLREGIRTVIVGKPNAGKSSLLNALSGTDRAIVTDVAGTTRDTLSETVRIGDIILNLTDTAGIHETDNPVEKIGIDRAEKAMESAQLILFVLDTASGIGEEDRAIAGRIAEQMRGGTRCIVLLNKSDLQPEMTEEDAESLFSEILNRNSSSGSDPQKLSSITSDTSDLRGKTAPIFVSLSLKDGTGLQSLQTAISELFQLGSIANSSEVFLSDERELEEARSALHSLKLVEQSIDDGMSEDFFSIDLRNAYSSLGRIIGEAVEDDLVEEIFSKFCLGK